jgi:4-hydroxy-2-oxoglutarate aldolase
VPFFNNHFKEAFLAMNEKLKGVFAPITTPFTNDGKVDYEGLKRNMERYARSPIHGYLALGSNGENKSLTNEEKMEVLKVIVANKAPKQIVMAGCIFESTFETISFAREFVRLGADFITLLPPCYFAKLMTDAVLIKYFTDVAGTVNAPCLVYCAPQFSAGITLSVNVVKEISKHPNIVGLKDSSMGNIDKYLMAVDPDFAVMAGSANFLFNAVLMGASGGVISLANIFPEVVVEHCQCAANADLAKGIALNKKILRLNKAVSGKGGVAAVKAAMDLAGWVGGAPRLPLLPLETEDVEVLQTTLRNEGMI